MNSEFNAIDGSARAGSALSQVSFDIRSYRSEDEPGLSDLHRDVSGIDLRTAYWEWKYRSNPAGDPLVCVAVHDGRIVGEAAAVPIRVKIGTSVVLACRASDIAVASGYRRAIPLSRLFETVLEEYGKRNWAFAFGIPDTRTLRMGTRLPGFVRVRSCRTLVKILNPKPFLKRGMKNQFLGSLFGTVGAAGFRISNSVLSRSKIKEIEIREEDRFDERFDKLWRQWSRDINLAVVRDPTYLNWRYCRDPIHRYKIFSANRGDECEGFIILCIRDAGDIRVGFIMDLMALPHDPRIFRSLLSSTVDYCFHHDVDCLNIWDPEHSPDSRLLMRVGFVARETPQLLVVRPGNRWRKDTLIDRAQWYLTLGDGDRF